MSTIVFYERNPRKWKKLASGMRLKTTNEELLLFDIGSIDDEMGPAEYKICIRKKTFKRLLSGKYKISDKKYLEIVDESNNPVQVEIDGKKIEIY